MNISTLLDTRKTLIMGILNITPDSFYDGGRFTTLDSALKHTEKMVQEGADIIDIGGESTRPGSDPISTQEEINRVVPIIQEIAKRFDVPISIDTYKSEIARIALESGASMVNDISGLTFDSEMAKIIGKKNLPVIIMHIKGTPKNMQENPYYKDVIVEIKKFFLQQIDYAIKSGIKKNQILIDPGIGFGKNLDHNLKILRNLREFKDIGQPIVIGTSRKSFIGKILGTETTPLLPEERLTGSIVSYVWSVICGVKILRVHDVKETKQALKILYSIIQ